MTASLQGKHIVITGGTGALGGTVVAKLLSEGAVCHVPNAHATAPAHFSYAGNDRVKLANNVDLADPVKVDAFYARIPELWASIHLAGGYAGAPIEATDPASFDEMMDTNARTTFLCCRAAVRSMLASGVAGRIVNVSARPGLDPRRGAGMVAYAASKAAVAAMTVALAEEVKGNGILVNAIAPSTLDTPANRAAMQKADFTRWVDPEAIAETVAALVSARNILTSGALIPLYGRA
ncbi:MAG TPA: SDR family NAD(P)-dependent oxidoreductase [Mesorhizobium sp.]|jgi:NAD(P)-dependent dehydrogenase (short-subunit alcohol dehydrogenase family)